MRQLLPKILIGSALLGAAVAQVIPSDSVATTRDIMLVMSVPASNAIFEADEKATDKQWAEYRRQAVILAESGNLLLMPGRAATGHTKDQRKPGAANPEGWNQAAAMMRDAGKLALRAIDKKDVDLLMGDVGEKILASCAACHDKYMIK